MISGAILILREEGLVGWSRGLTPSMLREISYSSVRMGAYEPIRLTISRKVDPTGLIGTSDGERSTHPAVKFFSALISGGVGAALANPLDLIKVRFQAQLPEESVPYTTTRQAFMNIYEVGGFGGLYKGWMITSSRAALLTSAQLGSYDSIKNNILIDHFGLKK